MTTPSSALEAETLRLLCESVGAEFVIELVEIFESSSATQLEVLRMASAQGDWKRLEIEAHSLKSAAAALGADVLSSLAAELELSAAQYRGPPQAVNLAIEVISRELELALTAQRSYLNALPLVG